MKPCIFTVIFVALLFTGNEICEAEETSESSSISEINLSSSTTTDKDFNSITYEEPAPTPIHDLKVEGVDMNKKEITLTWTATGLELYTGTAQSNLLTASTDPFQLEIGMAPLNDTFVVCGSLHPLPSGNKQKVTLKIPEFLWKASIKNPETLEGRFPLLYFAIKSFKSEGRNKIFSEHSNFAHTVDFKPMLFPEDTLLVKIWIGVIAVGVFVMCCAAWYMQTAKQIRNAVDVGLPMYSMNGK